MEVTMSLTVHALRKKKYRVQVLHNRLFDRTGKEPVLLPCGGSTTVIVYDKHCTKILATGFARCHSKMNYNRKLLVAAALDNLPAQFKFTEARL